MAAELDHVPAMLQGPGTLAEVGARARALAGGRAGAVLLVADPGLKPSGMVDEALAVLRRAGLSPVLFDALKSDPDIAQAEAGAALAREAGAGCVIALGGGSAMDVGKVVAAAAPGTLPVSAYGLCASPFPAKPLPKICVPTTSGTGSETTRTAILAAADHAKLWFWGAELKAELAVLDPVLTVGLPPFLTAATGIDALVHALEASTNRNANPVNDVYCHAAIRLVAKHLERAVSQPADLEARAALQVAAAFAGIGIDNCGTAIGHTIGHALGSLRPIHHGRAVGVALVATLPWNVEVGADAYAAVGAAMGEPAEAARLPAAFERLLRAVGLQVSVADEFAGVTPAALAAQMRRPENQAMSRSNRRDVTDADLEAFAQRVLTQA
jgi:alcohol dehydrogenase class IV